MKTGSVSRRSFLKLSSLVGGGFLLKGYWLPKVAGSAAIPEVGVGPWFFARFDPDGTLLLKLAKQEMGQSAPTGIAMLFAEELGMDWDKVRIAQFEYSAETNGYYDSPLGGSTGGSASVQSLWEPMRSAGAVVREMLIQAAAESWDVSNGECLAEGGAVLHGQSGRRLPFYALAERAARLPEPANPALRNPKDFKIIGKPMANAHNRAFATGTAEYGINVSLPGMAFATVERCPVLGAKLVSYDASETLKMPGVIAVYEMEGRSAGEELFGDYRSGVAVIAESTWAAFQGKAALKVTWDEGKNGSAEIDTLRRRFAKRKFLKSEIKNDSGDVEEMFAQADVVFEAEYETQFQAHASMEPLNATACFEGDSVEIWTSTQGAKLHAEGVARALSMPLENVKINSLVAGGSFGRRIWLDFVVEAALLAKKAGRPIKVTWTREDDIRHDYYHPYKRSVWRGCLDEDGYISALRNDYGVVGSNRFWWILHWAYLPYGIRNVKVTANLLEEPIETGAWRSVTEHLQAFPEETFIDELAYRAGEDPFAFRLKHTRRAVEEYEGDDYWRQMTQRALNVLESVSKLTDWGSDLPRGRGRGIAMSRFGSTVVAQVAEVEVQGDEFSVLKVDAIVAAGKIVNPQLAENQIEGAIIWGISALKYGKLTFEKGRILESNYHDYPILRMNEVPKMSVHFLSDDGPMGGIGEPGVPAVAPAVCNAIYAACGKRMRSLPVDLKS